MGVTAGPRGDIAGMDLTSQRQMLADAALVLAARTQLAELVDALALDLGDEAVAAALRRWLDEVYPATVAALRRLRSVTS